MSTEPRKHWRALTDSKSDTFNSADLQTIIEEQGGGKDIHVKIESAKGGSVTDFDSNKAIRKVMVKFVGIPKPLGMNVTNNRAMETLTGSPFPADWVGVAATMYVGKAERGRRKGDPEGTPAKVTVDAVRIRMAKVPPGANVYGCDSHAVDSFDLDGWRKKIGDCTDMAELTKVRAELNAAKPPESARAGLRKAVAGAEEAIRWVAMSDDDRAAIEAAQ